ncbi:MAG: hypothetical protein AAFY71_07920 [Bacteroidota bacterium]
MSQMHELIDFGQRFKDLFREKNIQQKKVAQMVGVAPQSLSSSLSRSNMNTDLVQKIMYVTGIKAFEIFQEQLGVVENIQQPVQVSSDLELQLKLCQNDVEHYKTQLEEKERMIQVLMGR